MSFSKKVGTGKNLIFLLLLVLISIPTLSLKKLWSEDKLLYDAVLGVEAISGLPTKILVWGKNYEKAEAKVALVELVNKKIKILWQSSNLYARGSNLMCAVGNFSSYDQEVIVLTDHGWQLYKVENNTLKEKFSGLNITGIMEVSAGDIDGDGYSELLVTSVAKLLNNTVDKKIVVYKFQDEELVKIKETKGLGNIRALTSLDLDNDGIWEIVYEEGQAYKKGTLTVLKDFETIFSESLRGYPIFALNSYLNGRRLLVGDDSGSVSIYKLDTSGSLEFIDKLPSVGWGLVAVTSGNFIGKESEQILLINNPAKAFIMGEPM